ncbi:MAG: uracil-DNA glycosylase [Clostridiaceae bacterium]|nr:uracil-DNA glycosylase [Clostridiaceae bacterium]
MRDWDTLQEACLSCTACALCQTRTNVVFGTGDRNAKLLFIGEAPGEQEDLSGIPFVGAAGKLLDDLLLSVGLSRERVYIANILKCRPPNNRDPLPAEQNACLPFLREQTALLSPRIIVCVGRIAACKLIDPDYKIMRQHGEWIERKNVLMTAVLHPSALLRAQQNRPPTYLDFVEIAQRAREENLI